VKDKQSNTYELEKYATETFELRDEIKALHEDVQAYREAVGELKGELEDAAEDKTALEAVIRDLQTKLNDMAHQLEEAKATAGSTARALDERGEETRMLSRQLEEGASRAAGDLRKANERAAAAERQVSSLQTEMRTIKEQTRVRELEESVASLQGQLSGLVEQRDELSHLLDAHNAQLEAYMREIRELETERASAIDEAVRAERKRLEASVKEVAGAGEALRDERTRAQELLTQKAEVERELEDARARLAAYERGYGLEDAIREQERLREAIRRRDADIARLTRTAGGQLDAYDILMEIARRLADRCGIPRTADVFRLYPELELRTSIESNVERLRAVNTELQRQNDALEEQRMKLLRQLRVHAEQLGDKSLRYFGLTAEQLMLVNEFAENLRDGRVELPVNDRTLELQGEVRRLRTALEEAQHGATANAAAAVAAAAADGRTAAGVAGAAATAAPGAGSSLVAEQVADATAREVQRQHVAMRETLKEVADENRKLREQVENMLGDQSRRFALLRGGAAGPASSSDAAVVAAAAAGEDVHVADMLAEILALVRPKAEEGVHVHPDDLAHVFERLDRATASAHAARDEAAASGSAASSSAPSSEAHVASMLSDMSSLLKAKSTEGAHLHPDDMQTLLATLQRAAVGAEESRSRAGAAAAAAPAAAAAGGTAAGAAGGARAGPSTFSMAAQLVEARAANETLRAQLAVAKHDAAEARAAAAAAGVGAGGMRGSAASSSSSASGAAGLKSPGPREQQHAHAAGGLKSPAAGVPYRSGQQTTETDAAGGGGFGPRSAAGRAMLIRRSGPDGAPMPADEWAAEVTDARAALVEALEELAAKEDEVKRFERQAREYSDKLGAMVAQQTALYREYISDKARWEHDLGAARDAEAAALERAEAAASKAARLDEMTAVLEGGADPATLDAAGALALTSNLGAGAGGEDPATVVPRLRNYVRALARKLASLEVAQPMLARKYNVLKQEAASARAGQRTAELSAVEAEAHMRQRILYLELWKKGAESRLVRFGEMLETWVPADEQAGTATALTELRARHTELLAAEGELRVQYTQLRGLPMRVAELERRHTDLTADLDIARATLAAARDEAGAARAALAAVTGGGEGGSSIGAAGGSSIALLQGASRGELIAAVTRQQASLNELEVQAAALTRKHDIAAARAVELEGALTDLQQRLGVAEDAAAAARALASKASADKAEAATAALAASAAAAASGSGVGKDLVGGLPSSPAALRELAGTLREERDALARELHKAREVADIASDQAAAVTGIAKDREAELEELRESLRNLSARGDDDAIIGRLQHQLLSLKASFHTFLRKHDGMRNALQRTRVASTALEVVLDQRRGEVLAVREDGRVKQLALQRLVDDFRDQVRTLESGGLSLSQAKAFNESVRRLARTVDRQAGELDEALRARHAAEEAAEARALEVASLQRTLEDIRAAGGRAGSSSSSSAAAAGTASSGEGRDVVRRLIDLNEQLKAAQLAALRQRRELAVNRDEARLAKKRIEDYEGAVRALEERIVAQDTEQRRREDEYRRQLRAAVTQAHAEAGEAGVYAAQAASGAAADLQAASSPGGTVADAAAGASAAASIADAAAAQARLAALTSAVEVAEKKARESGQRAADAVEQARVRKRRVAFLERQLELHGVDVAALRTGIDDDDNAGDAEGDSAAGNTSSRGGPSGAKPGSPEWDKERAQFKEDAASGMAKMREHYEEEARRLQKAAQATTASLKDLLQKKNAVIKDYQDRFETLRRERDAERTREMAERERIAQAAYEENRGTIERLRAALSDLQNSPASTAGAVVSQQLVERADALERAVIERERRIDELQTQIAGLSGSLVHAEGRAVGPGGETAESLAGEVVRLRKRAEDAERALKEGLATRDRKLKALQLSFAGLKKEFVEAEEAHARALEQLRTTTSFAARGAENGGGGGGAGSTLAPSSSSSASSLNASVSGIAGAEAGTFQEKVAALVEQVTRMGKEVRALKSRSQEAEEEKEAAAQELEKTKALLTSYKDTTAALEAQTARLRGELARVQSELSSTKLEAQYKLAEALSHGARMGADGVFGASMRGEDGGDAAADLATAQKRVRILEAQNAALRSAQAEAQAANAASSGMGGGSVDAAQLQAMITAAATAQAKAAVATMGAGMGMSAAPPAIPGTPGARTSSASLATPGGGEGAGDIRVAWDEQRKLRKRMEALQAKLNEKVADAESSRQSETATAAALAKTKAERDALEKRVTALIKKQQSLDAATVAALNEIEPVAALKSRVFELEEELAALRDHADGELAGEIRRLRGEIEGEKLRASAAAAEAADARDRLRQLQKLVGVDGGAAGTTSGAAVRQEEDRYLAEATLRDKLGEARRQVAALEGSLLTKDAAVMELQFELETARQAADRLRKRIAEVTAFATIATRGKPLSEAAAAGAAGGNLAGLLHDAAAAHNGRAGGPAKSAGKREAELEEVITALKRVTEKQKTEIERLRKQVEAGGKAKAAAASAAAASATVTALALSEQREKEREEAAAASAQLANSRDATADGVQRKAAAAAAAELAEANRGLKSARAEIKTLQDRVTSLSSAATPDAKAADALRQKLGAAESEARRLEGELQTARRGLAERAAEVDALRARAQQAEERQGAMERKLKETGNAGAIPPPLPPAPAVVVVAAPAPPAPAVAEAAGAAAAAAAAAAGGGHSSKVALAGGLKAVAAVSGLVGAAARHKASRSGSVVAAGPAPAPADASSASASSAAPASAAMVPASAPLDLSVASPDQLRVRVTALEKENSELREELSAFDLDFFEEIEDLKYKCVNLGRLGEGGGGQGVGRPFPILRTRIHNSLSLTTHTHPETPLYHPSAGTPRPRRSAGHSTSTCGCTRRRAARRGRRAGAASRPSGEGGGGALRTMTCEER
jgi:chromosome segregation ATPase